MKKCIVMFLLVTVVTGICFAEEAEENEGTVENRVELSFYASTRLFSLSSAVISKTPAASKL